MSGAGSCIFARTGDGPLRARATLARLPLLACLMAGAGCADLLEIPDSPRLVEGSPDVAPLPAPGGRAPASVAPERAEDERAEDDPFEDEPAASGGVGGLASSGAPPPAATALAPIPSAPSPSAGGAAPADAGVPPPDVPPPPDAPPSDAAPEPLGGCVPPESEGPTGDCYILFAATRSWSDAREVCLARGPGWDLATVRSAGENQFLSELGGDEAWIGASDADDEGTWLWVDDGEPFWRGNGTGRALDGAFENWNSDEPNGAGNSDCARLVSTARVLTDVGPTWADLECFELLPFICEGPPL